MLIYCLAIFKQVNPKVGNLPLGDSKKYPDHTTNGFLEFWGSEGKCGVLWTENLKAWEGDTYICTTQGIRRYRGVLDLELSQGILRQDCIPWRSLFYGLNQFTNKAQTVDTSDDCGSRINDKHPLLSRKTNKTWVVDQAPEALMPQDIHFSLTKTVS